jgi:hypothetical protein
VRVEELEDQSLDLRAVVKRFAVVDLKAAERGRFGMGFRGRIKGK